MSTTAETKERLMSFLEQVRQTTGQEPLSEARRASWRYTWVEPITVRIIDGGQESELLYANTKTIFADGMDFRSPRSFEQDCKVLITIDSEDGTIEIPATVVHSTGSVGMGIVGVRFDF